MIIQDSISFLLKFRSLRTMKKLKIKSIIDETTVNGNKCVYLIEASLDTIFSNKRIAKVLIRLPMHRLVCTLKFPNPQAFSSRSPIYNSQHPYCPGFHVERSCTFELTYLSIRLNLNFFHKSGQPQNHKMPISSTTCICIHHNTHYLHVFLMCTNVFN